MENVGERCVVCGGGGRPKLVVEELVGCVDGGWEVKWERCLLQLVTDDVVRLNQLTWKRETNR